MAVESEDAGRHAGPGLSLQPSCIPRAGGPLTPLAFPSHPCDTADPDAALLTQTIDGLGIALVVHGELDLATSPRLTRRVHQALCLPVDCITIDLSEVEFMDSQGLHALDDARLAAREQGIALVLASPSRSVRRLLEVTVMTDLFEVRDSP
jgi:anti-sigma B factor antagonist